MNSGRAIEFVPEEIALGSTFRENAARSYRFIYAKVGNRAAAEDLTSQVFLKAVRWLAQDRSADRIRAWLYTIARSTIARLLAPAEPAAHGAAGGPRRRALLWAGGAAGGTAHTRARLADPGGAAVALPARLHRPRDWAGAGADARQRARAAAAGAAPGGHAPGSGSERAGRGCRGGERTNGRSAMARGIKTAAGVL